MNKEIEEMAEKLTKYKNSGCKLKKDLQATYDRLKDLPDNMKYHELQLIWYLRNTRFGEAQRFFRLAKRNYEVAQATDDLCNPKDFDKK